MINCINKNEINKSGIYKITSLINEKIYIGSTNCFRARFSDHKCELKNGKHSNSYLQNSWDKYGANNFKFEVIEIVDDLNLLQEREQFWLDEAQSYKRSIGYNILTKAYSSQGYKHTDESKEQNRIRNLGNRKSAKLSKEDVFNIRLILRDTDLNHTEISKMFPVNSVSILCISRNQTWQEVIVQPGDVLCEEYLNKSLEIKNNRKPLRKTNKLDEAQVKTIKLLLRDTNLKQSDICKLFNVDATTISYIKRGKTWYDIVINSHDKLDSYYVNIVNNIYEGR